MKFFFDTSALLAGGAKQYSNVWISPLVLTELENIKNSNKPEHIKCLAREAVRDIIYNNVISVFQPSEKLIDKFIKKHDFLSNINDHRLLGAAVQLQEDMDEPVIFVTSDAALYLFAQSLDMIGAHYLEQEPPNKNSDYKGWREVTPTENELVELYSHPENNILHLNTNEYAKIIVDDQLKDIQFWDGNKYRALNYKNVKNKFLGETIKPRNIEQKMAFDLLQNRDITVKLLVGVAGGGKDALMIYHALDLIQQGYMDKIIFVRNLVPFKDAPEIGFLSGDINEKIRWGLGPIIGQLGEEGLLQYEEQGIIEAVNLGFIRGCQFTRTIIYVSEGQNITGGGYKLLVSRCGEGSELWVNGDVFQTDNRYFEKNNGILRITESLKDDPLFGMVYLPKTERSKTAELASRI